mmetsp:Transcript_50678/g.109448  ORF Transcript_50678/g.109448 Transcript_50678/m.109448 type:complete len:114 (+) Transcript_50678:1055-1396(+)
MSSLTPSTSRSWPRTSHAWSLTPFSQSWGTSREPSRGTGPCTGASATRIPDEASRSAARQDLDGHCHNDDPVLGRVVKESSELLLYSTCEQFPLSMAWQPSKNGGITATAHNG